MFVAHTLAVPSDAPRLSQRKEDVQFLSRVSELLASSLDYDLTVSRIVHVALPRLADWAILYELAAGGEVRRLAVAHADPDFGVLADQIRCLPVGERVRESPLAIRLGRGESVFVPHVEPGLLESIAESEDHRRVLESLAPRSAMAVPLDVHGQVLGGLVLLSSRPGRTYSLDDLALAQKIGARAAVAFLHACLFREARAAESRSTFLANVLDALCSSLESDVSMVRVASLLVPELADLCIIDLVDDRGRLERAAVACADPARREQAARLRAHGPPDGPPEPSVEEAWRSGRPIALERLDPDLPSSPPLVRDFHISFGFVTPLAFRNRVLGVLSLYRTGALRPFSTQDLDLGVELGRKLAAGLENARLYREARRLCRLKDEFLASLSHELRTPLNAMLGWSRLLRMGVVAPDRVPRALETIDRSAQAQARLVADMLDVSRILGGTLDLVRRPIDLTEVVARAVDAIRPIAQDKSIVLEHGPATAQSLMVDGDPERLEQIVWHLLSNAVKFTPEGGRVSVAVACDDQDAELLVADTGAGIDEAVLSTLFDAPHLTGREPQRPYAPLRLGLVIVQRLTELHGGTVAASSPGRGLGATFRVRLPLLRVFAGRERVAPPAEGDAPLAETGSLKGRSALIVDDERDARDLFRLVLEQQGMIAAVSASAEDALEAMRQRRFDVVLIDVAMPGADGFALLRAMRTELDDTHRPRAVAVTAQARGEARARAVQAGFDLYVTKPVVPTTLVEAVARVLSGSPALS